MQPADASRLINSFRADFAREFDLIHITHGVIDEAMKLAERHALRGYDAVQLSAALAAHAAARSAGTSVTLVSADLELNAAGALEGLGVDDPNKHP